MLPRAWVARSTVHFRERGFPVGHRLAVDPRVGKQRGKVISWVPEPVRSKPREVGVEVEKDGVELIRLAGGVVRLALVPRGFRILRSEELLGEHEHTWPVGFRDTKDIHDDLERIAQSHITREIATPSRRQHSVYRSARDLADAVFQLAPVLR